MWARASSLHRHIACPAASWLPRWERDNWSSGYLGFEAKPDFPGDSRSFEAADWGTAMHAAKAGQGDAPFTSYLPQPVIDKWWPQSQGRHEQAYSYNCETGKVEVGPYNLPVEDMNDWKESRAAACITGTSDWAGLTPLGDEWWIDDLKTGWEQPQVDTPAMLFYAVCRHDETGLDSGRLSITHYARSNEPEPSQIRRYWLAVGLLQLEDFREEMHKAWRMTRRKGLDIVKAGPHCEYCPSVTVCPLLQFKGAINVE